MFVLGVSAYYLLKGRDIEFAKRSFSVAASFGLVATIGLIVLGDESGAELRHVQPVKLAAIEGEWHTEEAPAAFNVIAFPDQDKMENHFAIQIPYVMGIIATRSLDTQVLGIHDLKDQNEERIRTGIHA